MTKSYEDLKYQQKNSLYDTLEQVFQDYKNKKFAVGANFATHADTLRGCTMHLHGTDMIELVTHKYENSTVPELEKLKITGPKFIKEVEKVLKTSFKEATGKALTMTVVKEHPTSFEKASMFSYESISGRRPVARYLVRDAIVYKFSADL